MPVLTTSQTSPLLIVPPGNNSPVPHVHEDRAGGPSGQSAQTVSPAFPSSRLSSPRSDRNGFAPG